MGRHGLLLLTAWLFAVPLWGRNYAEISVPPAGKPLALPAEGVVGDFLVECVFRPKAPASNCTLAELSFGASSCQLLLSQEQLTLVAAGQTIAHYPLYHAGCLPPRLKAGDSHILVQRHAGILSAFVDGYPMRQTAQPRLDTPLLSFVPGQSIEQLHIASGYVPPQEVRPRYLEQVQGRKSIRPPTPPIACVPQLTAKPALDGVPDDSLPTVELPMRSSAPKQSQQWQPHPVTVRIARFQNSLYLAWDIRDGRKPWRHTYGRRDGPLWNLESVELFLVPPDSSVPFQFIVSVGGELYDAHGEDNGWNASVEWSVAPRQDGWSGEILLDTGTNDLPALQDGATWKADFFASRQWRAWSPVAPYNDHSRYGLLTFADNAPAVRSLNIASEADGSPALCGELLPRQPCQMTLQFFAPGEMEADSSGSTLTPSSDWQTFRIRFPATAKQMAGGFAWTLTGTDGQPLFRHSGLLNQPNSR